MANNRKTTRGRKTQVIYSAPRRIFKEKYLTPKGLKLLAASKDPRERKIIRSKYTKNRYTINPDAQPIKLIRHHH